MQVTQNSRRRGKFSAPPTSRLQCCSSGRFPPTSFSSSSDSKRASPRRRRFRERTALQRSFCTWCSSKRNCFQAHTPATGLSRHSYPRGPLQVAGCALGSRASQRFSLRKRSVHFTVQVQWMTSSTFSLSQQDNKCLGAPSRESHAPQRTKKTGVTAMQSNHAHQQSWSVARIPPSPETHTLNLRS